MAAPTINWQGSSGTTYTYWTYQLDAECRPTTELQNVAGNYIFAKESSPNYYVPLYIGETSELKTRLDNHNEVPCLKSQGATHVHVHTSSQYDATRRTEEQDLITKWNPACNG